MKIFNGAIISMPAHFVLYDRWKALEICYKPEQPGLPSSPVNGVKPPLYARLMGL